MISTNLYTRTVNRLLVTYSFNKCPCSVYEYENYSELKTCSKHSKSKKMEVKRIKRKKRKYEKDRNV